jgi:tetratricopeptide (TPR) repeat protein
MATLSSRMAYAVLSAASVVLVATLSLLVWDWLYWLQVSGLVKHGLRLTAIGFLETLLACYPVVLVSAIVASAVLGWLVSRSGSRAKLGRWLLLCVATVAILLVAEAAAAGWLSRVHGLPAMPRQFADPPRPRDEVVIVVIGGSSALGVPYESWFSLGSIVEAELRKAIPARQFRVEVLAEEGANLERMHRKLATLTTRPDALVVYCGHNEFLARFSLSNRVSYYVDDATPARVGQWFAQASRSSPLCTLARENLEKMRIGMMPARSFGGAESVVGRPVCTPGEANAVVADFHRRLEAIVKDCEQIGCLPILVIPPSSDVSDPNQSCAKPGTTAEGRQALARRLIAAQELEKRDPAQAIANYHAMLADQPTYAHAHFRLARVREAAGSFAEAVKHYQLARDGDGLPLRCIAPLEAAYRSVAAQHAKTVVLVDGPAALRDKSRHGILDDHLFHDNVHPTLVGYVALAEALLGSLQARGGLGWPASTPAPRLDPRQYALQFRIDSPIWATVCERSASFYDHLAYLSADSTLRLEWRRRYAEAAHRIRAGARPEDVGIIGVGVDH